MPLLTENVSGSGILRLRRRIPGVDDYFVLLHNETTIGRHPSNRICVPRKTISRFHARIMRNANKYALQDLTSSNGTFVNGKRVESLMLKNGDKVTFGDLEFAFYQDEETSAGLAKSESNVRLGTTGILETVDRVLHVKSLEDAESALVSIAKIESLPLAAQYLRAHYQLLEIARQRPSQERLLESFLEIVVEMLHADRGIILLSEEEGKNMEPVAVHFRNSEDDDEAVCISQTIVDRCVAEQVAILSRDAGLDQRFSDAQSVIMQKVRSAICAPLTVRGRAMGVCYLDVRSGEQSFSDSDLAFVTNLSSQLVLALDNLRMTRERLQAEQLALIGQTMSEVSHSLKNILSVTQSGAEVMDRHLSMDRIEAAKKTWILVRHGMQRMHDLATAMLDYSRTEARERSEVQINDVVTQVYEDLRPEMDQAGIRLEIHTDPQLKPCWIDSAGLFDALMNLAMNSRDALAETSVGMIEIRTVSAPGNRVQVSVSDNGEGISPDILDKIFRPFFTTKGAHGNGMGLAMVEKYAREMGGAVAIDSTPGHGTEIRLLFPALTPEEDEDEAEQDVRPQKNGQPAPGNGQSTKANGQPAPGNGH